MRGHDSQQGHMWSYVQPEQRVPQDHPLRPIRVVVDQALKALSPRFALLYSHTGRPSIPPEQLLWALLLQAFYSIRSERQLTEELDYNLLFRWFVGLSMDDPIWDPTVFTKNRNRLLQGDVAPAFFEAVKRQAEAQGLLSPEHFTVDGMLLEAWASHKSFQPQGCPPCPRQTTIRGIPPCTSVARSAATPRIGPRRTPTPSWSGRAGARPRPSPTAATSSWRTGTASWSRPRPPG